MEICAAGDVLKAGAHMVEKERKAEKRFEEASQECHKLVDLIDKLNDENDLVKLVEIVDRLGELVENLHEWREQYKRLKALREDQIQPAIFSLEKNRKSLDKWIADVRKVLRETFIDLMEKIKK
jgi:tRNA U55 pseudouridine synthase TruB